MDKKQETSGTNEDVNIRSLVEQMDKIELVDMQVPMDIKNNEIAVLYLDNLYKDLIQRTANPEKGIPRVVLVEVTYKIVYFSQLLNCPGLIGERLFSIFDADKDGYSSKQEFFEAACRIMSYNFEDNLKIVFDIYDFDGDGLISQEDIRTLLSHVPLSEILAGKKDEGRKEGAFTKSGGGL